MPLGILGGTLLATALKALFDVGSTISANKFNSPKAMKKRVRDAGLPLSYMYQGKVSTQSEVPKLSIDPTLGTLPDIQGKKMKQDTKLTKLQAEDLTKDIQVKDIIQEGETSNNRLLKASSEANRAKAESFIKQYESELKKIELDVEKDAFGKGIPQQMKMEALNKASQQVKNLLAQAGLMGQLEKIRGFEEILNASLTKDLESLPDWISSLLKIILIATKRK